MSYVTYEYYSETFVGESVAETDFPSLCRRAEEIVEEMVLYRLSPTAFESMDAAVQERVRNAVCAQIEYLDANGGSEMDMGSDLQSAALGKFSYTKSSGTGGSTKQSLYSPRALRYLAPTGLLYRGGGCY